MNPPDYLIFGGSQKMRLDGHQQEEEEEDQRVSINLQGVQPRRLPEDPVHVHAHLD